MTFLQKKKFRHIFLINREKNNIKNKKTPVHDAQTRSARQGQRGSRLGMAGDSLVGSVVSPTRGYHLGGDGFPSDGSAAQPALAWTTVPADDHCCALCPSEFLYVFETIDDILIIIGWVCVYRP